MLSLGVSTTLVGGLVWAQMSKDCSSPMCFTNRALLVGCACLAGLILFHVILYPVFLSPLRHLPGPKQASLYRRLMSEPDYEDLIKWINEIPNHGLLRYYGIFNQERVFVTTPQGCRDVLQAQGYNYIKLPWALEVMSQFGPLGILVAPPTKHRVDRKRLQPAFKFKYIKDLSTTFWTQGAKFLRVVEKQLVDEGKGTIDIGLRLQHITLDIITLTSFGALIGAVDEPGSTLVKHFRNLFSAKARHLQYRVLAFVLPYWMYRRLPMQARYEIMQARDTVSGFIRPLIQQRRDVMAADSKEYAEGDIIATLLRSGEEFTDQYLIDQSMDFMVAGQETTSTAVTFALYSLSNNPEIQQRLRDEIRDKLPPPSEDDRTVDSSLIEALPYLTAVCNEVLRLYSPVVYCHRQAVAPDTTIGGVPIPKDTVVVVAPGPVHESRHVWGSNAQVFDPERWLIRKDGDVTVDPLGGTGDVWAVMPFTFGPRQCIGERFARGEMLSLVAQLVGRFEWRFKGIGKDGDKPMRIVRYVVAGPAGGGATMYAKRIGGW